MPVTRVAMHGLAGYDLWSDNPRSFHSILRQRRELLRPLNVRNAGPERV